LRGAGYLPVERPLFNSLSDRNGHEALGDDRPLQGSGISVTASPWRTVIQGLLLGRPLLVALQPVEHFQRINRGEMAERLVTKIRYSLYRPIAVGQFF